MNDYSFEHDEKIIKVNTSDCGCKQKQTTTCNTCGCTSSKPADKIQLTTPVPCEKHFAVKNYFSELVNEWEKEAAKSNLGIKELLNIEYYVDEADLLSKVRFTFKQGHEEIKREFNVAPKGDPGEPFSFDDLTEEQLDLLRGALGKQGETPVLNKVNINWMENGHEYGEFVGNECSHIYDLNLYLNKPDAIKELSHILDLITLQLKEFYVSKIDLESRIQKFSLEFKMPISFTRNGSAITLYVNNQNYTILLPNYSLVEGDNLIILAVDGIQLNKVTTVKQASAGTIGGIKLGYNGSHGIPVQIDGNGRAYVATSGGIEIYYTQTTDSKNAPIWNINDSRWVKIKPLEADDLYTWCAIVNNGICTGVFRVTPIDGKDGLNGSDSPLYGTQGLVGAVIRIKGEYDPQKVYVNLQNKQTIASTEIKYIDVVYVKNGQTNPSNYLWFKVKAAEGLERRVKGKSPVDADWRTYWEQAESVEFSYISTLISEYAQVNYLVSKEVRIFDENNKIVAGMTSGYLNNLDNNDEISSAKTEGVRIWAGNSYTTDDSINLATAPFSVTNTGYLRASNAEIRGTLNITELNLTGNNSSYYEVTDDVTLPSAPNVHKVVFLFTDDKNHNLSSDSGIYFNINGAYALYKSNFDLLPNTCYLAISYAKGWKLIELSSASTSTGGGSSKLTVVELMPDDNGNIQLPSEYRNPNKYLLPVGYSNTSTVNYHWGFVIDSHGYVSTLYEYNYNSGEETIWDVTRSPYYFNDNKNRPWTNITPLSEYIDVYEPPIAKSEALSDADASVLFNDGGIINISSSVCSTKVAATGLPNPNTHDLKSGKQNSLRPGQQVVLGYENCIASITLVLVEKILTAPNIPTLMQNGSLILDGKTVGEVVVSEDNVRTYYNYTNRDLVVLDAESTTYTKVKKLSHLNYSNNNLIWVPDFGTASNLTAKEELITGPSV